MPPKRLCSIYLRDVAGFLPRKEVDKCREMSQHSRCSLVTRLPRHKYGGVSINLAIDPVLAEIDFIEGCVFYRNIDTTTDAGRTGRTASRPFDVSPLLRCECAMNGPPDTTHHHQLVGRRIFPHSTDDAVVRIQIGLRKSDRVPGSHRRLHNHIDFRAVNRLVDAPTVGHLLHFLSHLLNDEVCFDNLKITPIPESSSTGNDDSGIWAINPIITQTLHTLRNDPEELRQWTLSQSILRARDFSTFPNRALSRSEVAALRNFSVFKRTSVTFPPATIYQGMEQDLLDFVCTAGGGKKGVHEMSVSLGGLGSCVELLSRILELFITTLDNLSRCVKSVYYYPTYDESVTAIYGGPGWLHPRLLTTNAAQQPERVTITYGGEQREMAFYRLTNINSGQHFKVGVGKWREVFAGFEGEYNCVKFIVDR